MPKISDLHKLYICRIVHIRGRWAMTADCQLATFFGRCSLKPICRVFLNLPRLFGWNQHIAVFLLSSWNQVCDRLGVAAWAGCYTSCCGTLQNCVNTWVCRKQQAPHHRNNAAVLHVLSLKDSCRVKTKSMDGRRVC